ncbi:MAG: hypothetical protein RIC35_22800 [Marinoscillum sp.]
MDSIVQYFNGEKLQCIIGVVISIVCIGSSVYFLQVQSVQLKGIASTFLPISIFLMIVCVGVIVRTPTDIERVTNFYNTQPAKIQTEEITRMEKVMKSFKVIKTVEIGLFLVGVALMVIFWHKDLVRGIAAGLIIQGLVMYLFDHFAELRGQVYMDFLKSYGL